MPNTNDPSVSNRANYRKEGENAIPIAETRTSLITLPRISEHGRTVRERDFERNRYHPE